ncbi:hypothetical protein Cni_G25460 [Canna indica]|uniref:RCD1 WWE domain-containing protein n=1 Tax=Canna indica TaxID=4628 RepID=A0AAQ3L012_9LILI|nr:hypothetical protein Cni_G25460 [Canna indica]
MNHETANIADEPAPPKRRGMQRATHPRAILNPRTCSWAPSPQFHLLSMFVDGNESALENMLSSLERGVKCAVKAPTEPGVGNRRLIAEFKNFKSRSAPTRILFFRNGSWIDFTHVVFGALCNEFVAGKTAFELPIAAYSYVFDFLTMSQIDAHDRCFFPALVVDERRNLLRFDKGASPVASFECDSVECHREARISADNRKSFAVVLQGTKMTNEVAAVVAHGFGQPN